MKKLFYLTLIIFSVFSSCNDDESENKSPIIGNWKLSQGKIYVTSQTGEITLKTVNYDQQNIVYNFKSDNTLVISGANSETLGYNNGDYKFNYNSDNIEIDNLKWMSTYSKSTLILDQSYVDGSQLILTRN